MKIRPLQDRVIVRRVKEEEKTKGGLYIPDTAKEKPQQGKVLAVGAGRWSDDEGKHFPLDIKVDDTVLYSKYGGTEVTIDGEDLLILSSRDVLAIVEK
jgi:chaperonin GroES